MKLKKGKLEIYSSIQELKAAQCSSKIKRSKKQQQAYDKDLKESFEIFHHALVTGEPITRDITDNRGKMKIQYCSDLHLEISDNLEYLQNTAFLKPAGDILIIAGDFYVFRKNSKNLSWFIDRYCKQYNAVYWLPGNHEYYGFSATQADKPTNKQIADNLFLVNNISVRVKDVNLIFSTLWSHIQPENELICKAYVNDFQVINYFQKESLRPYDFNQLHKKSLNFLSVELARSDAKKNIVITHHVPTMKNYPDSYKTSKINNAFVTELEPFILSQNIDAWIYGHSHVNTPDFMIGKTKMLTNQLGYVGQEEHLSYNDSAIINL